jgi:hypothetical protein
MRANGERWAAASGYVVVLFGIAGAAFERGGPPLNAPVEQTIAFFSTYRSELLLQSLMFVWSAGAYIPACEIYLWRVDYRTDLMAGPAPDPCSCRSALYWCNRRK